MLSSSFQADDQKENEEVSEEGLKVSRPVEALSSLRRWDVSSFGPVALQGASCALKRILPPTLCVDPYRLGAETDSGGPCPPGILHGVNTHSSRRSGEKRISRHFNAKGQIM
ncbi:hypothetical protein MHYP_G00168130 [Metynnis hypsauchen]